MTDAQMIDLQVKLRADAEPEFLDRLRPMISVITELADGDDAAKAAAIGGAGLALHLDDLANNRWAPAQQEVTIATTEESKA